MEAEGGRIDESEESEEFGAEHRAYITQLTAQRQHGPVAEVTRIYPTNMVSVWEDTSDWDMGDDQPYKHVAALAQERVALTEEELLEVMVCTLPELALHQLLAEQVEDEEESTASEQGSVELSFDTPKDQGPVSGDLTNTGFAAWSPGRAYKESREGCLHGLASLIGCLLCGMMRCSLFQSEVLGCAAGD